MKFSAPEVQMKRRSVLPLIVVGFLTLSQIASFATQVADSGISGVVRDPRNAVIVGAAVTATSETGQTLSATTNEQGRFRIDNVPPGRYRVVVESKGFKRAERSVIVEKGRLTLD